MAVPAVDEQLRTGIAGIDQMLRRQELFGRQSGVNGGCHRIIGRRALGGEDVGDHVRGVIVIRLAQVGLVADPVQVALGAVAGLDIL
jgi:hypothetical protein